MLYLTDTLGRRHRYGPRQPKGNPPTITKRDRFLFGKLQLHGDLPSHYLWEFSKHLRKDRHNFQTRLKELFHHGYLLKPDDQQATTEKKDQYLTYQLDKPAYKALKDQRFIYATKADKGWYVHQFGTACCTASIELAALRKGYQYAGQEDIFKHAYCPQSTRDRIHEKDKKKRVLPLSLILGQKTTYNTKTGKKKLTLETITCDQLFRITYPTKHRFFVLEFDRATEDKDTMASKFERWIRVLENELYREQWGVPSLMVLVITTDPQKMVELMHKLSQLTDDPEIRKAFLFKCKTEFCRKYWVVPPIMYDLLDTPWATVGGSYDISY